MKEDEIRNKIFELSEELERLENMLQLHEVKLGEIKQEEYIFTLNIDSLDCEKYVRFGEKEEEYFIRIDRNMLNKLVSWLVSLGAVKVDG